MAESSVMVVVKLSVMDLSVTLPPFKLFYPLQSVPFCQLLAWPSSLLPVEPSFKPLFALITGPFWDELLPPPWLSTHQVAITRVKGSPFSYSSGSYDSFFFMQFVVKGLNLSHYLKSPSWYRPSQNSQYISHLGIDLAWKPHLNHHFNLIILVTNLLFQASWQWSYYFGLVFFAKAFPLE